MTETQYNATGVQLLLLCAINAKFRAIPPGAIVLVRHADNYRMFFPDTDTHHAAESLLNQHGLKLRDPCAFPYGGIPSGESSVFFEALAETGRPLFVVDNFGEFATITKYGK